MYTFTVLSLAGYKKCITWTISFGTLYDALPTFTFASVIRNVWKICLGVNILIPVYWDHLNQNILLLKAWTANYFSW